MTLISLNINLYFLNKIYYICVVLNIILALWEWIKTMFKVFVNRK